MNYTCRARVAHLRWVDMRSANTLAVVRTVVPKLSTDVRKRRLVEVPHRPHDEPPRLRRDVEDHVGVVRQQEIRAAIVRRHNEDIFGPGLHDVGQPPERFSGLGHRLQTDELVEAELAGWKWPGVRPGHPQGLTKK